MTLTISNPLLSFEPSDHLPSLPTSSSQSVLSDSSQRICSVCKRGLSQSDLHSPWLPNESLQSRSTPMLDSNRVQQGAVENKNEMSSNQSTERQFESRCKNCCKFALRFLLESAPGYAIGAIGLVIFYQYVDPCGKI